MKNNKIKYLEYSLNRWLGIGPFGIESEYVSHLITRLGLDLDKSISYRELLNSLTDEQFETEFQNNYESNEDDIDNDEINIRLELGFVK